MRIYWSSKKGLLLSITFENEVAVTVDGMRFRFWESISIKTAIDNISTLELGAPFDSSDPNITEVFKPFTYKPIATTINDDAYFTGTISPVMPQIEPSKSIVSVGAYSLPGVLNEVTVSGDNIPLELSGLNLHEIADHLCTPFEFIIDARVEPGAVFPKVAMRPNDKILPFLAKLSKQRAQVISNTAEGALLFWEAVESGSPVAKLVQGESPLVDISPTFKPGQYYSEITGLKATRVRSKNSAKFKLENPVLSNVTRPYTFELTDTDDADLETVVTAKMGRMLADSVKYTATIATWRDPQGALWEPNTLITVEAPDAMIYKPYTFLIQGVTLNKTANSEQAFLTLVLPGSFSSADPGGMPWDD